MMILKIGMRDLWKKRGGGLLTSDSYSDEFIKTTLNKINLYFMYRIYTTYKFLGRSEVEGNEKLFNTSVYVKSKGFDCLELVNPV